MQFQVSCLRMTMNKIVLEKPSEIMTFVFRNITSLLYEL